MGKAFAFEIKVVLVLAAVLLMVATTGILAYKSLTGIVRDVDLAVRPDEKLTLLKQISADLYDAESSVKSYNLTHNNDYLSPFYNSVASVDDRMNELSRLSKNDTVQRAISDSINMLIEKKYELLNEMLALRHDEKITNELKKISLSLETKMKIDPAQEENESPTTEEKSGNIFKKIFGRKKTTESPIHEVSSAEKQTIHLKDVQKEIEKVNRKQLEQLKENHEKELALTRENKVVMDKIRNLISKAEKNEKEVIALKTKRAESSAQRINTFIAFFCGAIMLLLLMVSYVIVRYARKRREYRKALKKAKTEAENLARARESFVATMSHEIRTPMNAIAGFTEQVLMSKLNAEQKSQLDIVKKSADHLIKITNDVLDFSKIQAGKLSLEQIGFMPHEIVNEVILLMTPLAKNKKLNLSHEIEPDVQEIVIGDSFRLKQILINLMGNAIKFTEQGEINLRVSSVRQNGNKVVLSISIQDTGIGIARGKLKHIFEEFEQANESISKKYGGTGLGLTITKKLAEMQGGSIDISSEPSKGSLFTVSIPYECGTHKDLQKPETAVIQNGLLKGKNILIADDETYNCILIASILKKWEVNCTEAKTGEETLSALENNFYDVIIMDVRMPGKMDGIKASQQIRKMQDTQKAKTPIIALTAISSPEDIARCKEAGMNDFLAKPFKEKDLHQRIISVLFGEEKYKDAQIFSNEENDGDEGKYSLEGVKHMAHGDEKFFNELVSVFIHSTREGIMRMNEAYAEKNWMKIADYAHKTVPPCIHFDANHLVTTLKTIENNIRKNNSTESVPFLLKQAASEAETIINDLEKNMP